MDDEKELYFLIQGSLRGSFEMTKEEVALFNKMIKEDPETWRNKEVSLLTEVRKILREETDD